MPMIHLFLLQSWLRQNVYDDNVVKRGVCARQRQFAKAIPNFDFTFTSSIYLPFCRRIVDRIKSRYDCRCPPRVFFSGWTTVPSFDECDDLLAFISAFANNTRSKLFAWPFWFQRYSISALNLCALLTCYARETACLTIAVSFVLGWYDNIRFVSHCVEFKPF